MMCVAFALVAGGCKGTPNQPAPIVDANSGVDPAAANMAPIGPNDLNAPPQPVGNASPLSNTNGYARAPQRRVLDQRNSAPNTASGEQYAENDPPQQASSAGSYPAQNGQQSYGDPNDNGQGGYDPDYGGQYDNQVDDGQQALYADQAPPPLPDYEQPELTDAGYEWTPGYWNYGGGAGYFWVPGAWVAPPYAGALWTPGYWGREESRYRFHHGFWARHIGYYGGIPYGYGYGGLGYNGGYWNNNRFYYNDAVNRVDVRRVHTIYTRRENTVDLHDRHDSFAGPGGYDRRPQAQELAVAREQRTPPMQVQAQRVQAAEQNRQQFFIANHGHPAIAAAAEHFAADHTPPATIAPRGGFGQQSVGLQQQRLQQVQAAQNASHAQQLRQQQVAAQNQQRVQQQNAQRQQAVQNNAHAQQPQQQQAAAQNQQRVQQQNGQRQQELQRQEKVQNNAHAQQLQQQQAAAQNQQRVQQQNGQRQQELQRQQTVQNNAHAQQLQQQQAAAQNQQRVQQQDQVRAQQEAATQRQQSEAHQQQLQQQQRVQQQQQSQQQNQVRAQEAQQAAQVKAQQSAERQQESVRQPQAVQQREIQQPRVQPQPAAPREQLRAPEPAPQSHPVPAPHSEAPHGGDHPK